MAKLGDTFNANRSRQERNEHWQSQANDSSEHKEISRQDFFKWKIESGKWKIRFQFSIVSPWIYFRVYYIRDSSLLAGMSSCGTPAHARSEWRNNFPLSWIIRVRIAFLSAVNLLDPLPAGWGVYFMKFITPPTICKKSENNITPLAKQYLIVLLGRVLSVEVEVSWSS